MIAYVVMPAHNTVRTLERTVLEIPAELRSHVLLIDDGSTDGTGELGRKLGLEVLRHERNLGYGAVQKTGYRAALQRGAEAVLMLHSDYQYPAISGPAMLALLADGRADVVLGSRMSEGDPRDAGMGHWRYWGNRGLTAMENLAFNLHLTEYHTGLRAFSARFLQGVRFEGNSDDFVFDQQILAQAVAGDFRIVEIPSACRYFEEASSISFRRSVRYGLATVRVAAAFRLHRAGVFPQPWLEPR